MFLDSMRVGITPTNVPKQVAIVCEPRVIMRAYHYIGA